MPGVQAIAKQVVETVGSVAGIRIGLEEPKFNAVELARGVQVRYYRERIAAQTRVVGQSEDQARSTGFRRLATYIFGGNDGGRSIAMTAPVAVQTGRSGGTKIAMTAPVAQRREADEWVIRFFMPARWTMDTLPRPDDPRVELVTVPPETYAVLRFSGGYHARRVAEQTARLRDVLRQYGFEATGEPTAWFFDPPWTLPFRRRNEVAIPVE
ncbi:heme-binding protein [Mycolicibacterium cosmeticum]|uniref:SOUL heme-binding protein n=1 Tax=Mycolicibacterium cosmeticum TaxID=258533 RepID=W9B684_MYCCO|nr:heme-binding protein [Mycolicibacterium cosmeticum]TLH81382.1 heme-binding protein [Mycolicibacterium cosmeticum]CDO10522.1 SOUL heme-binding protein [Mycolicibacterium cosmeticum]